MFLLYLMSFQLFLLLCAWISGCWNGKSFLFLDKQPIFRWARKICLFSLIHVCYLCLIYLFFFHFTSACWANQRTDCKGNSNGKNVRFLLYWSFFIPVVFFRSFFFWGWKLWWIMLLYFSWIGDEVGKGSSLMERTMKADHSSECYFFN